MIDGMYKLNDDMTYSAYETEAEYMEAMKNYDKSQNKIALTNLPNGFYVSTVFLRLDHSFGGDEPEIFETMVFNQNKLQNMIELDCNRYSTYREAITGHHEMVETWLKKIETESTEELLGDTPRGKMDLKDAIKGLQRAVKALDRLKDYAGSLKDEQNK